MLGMKGRKYEMWWSDKADEVGGAGIMVMEELCEKMVEVRKLSERVMNVVFEEDVLRLICGYAPQNGRSLKKRVFMTR